MLTPSGVTLAQYLTAVRADKPSHVKITFTGQGVVLEDEDIESSGIKINHFLNGDTDLIFGRAVMANITIPVLNTSKVASLIWNGEFKFEIGQEIDNNTIEWITVGYFSGNRPEKVNTVNVIDFTANDRMSKFDRLADDWIASLTYPITVQGMFQSLCTYCGVGYVSGDELPNIFARSYSESPFLLEGQTCRDILGQIAEACGCYARITNSGSVKLVWFTDHTADYTLTEDYEYPPIETFDIFGKKWKDVASLKWSDLGSDTWGNLAGNLGAFKINSLYVVDSIANMATIVPTVKRSGNVYTIIDNPFLSYANNTEKAAYITPIYNRLAAFDYYVPMKAACVGCALIEAGDIIEVVVNGSTINMPIFCIQTVWNGSLTDEYETTGQLNRAEVNVEKMVKLSESARYVLTMEQIRLIAQGKYDIQSDIEILPEGIQVTGGKYVKIISGGTFDVDSANFKIDSANKLLQTGNWTLTENGLEVVSDNTSEHPDYAIFSRFSNGGVWNTSGFRIDCALWQSYANRYEIGTAKFAVQVLYDLDFTTYYGVDFSPAESMDDHGGRISGIGSLGKRNKWTEIHADEAHINEIIIQGRKQIIRPNGDNYGYVGTSDYRFWYAYITNIYGTVYNPSSKEIKHDIKDMDDVGDFIDKLNPVTFIYNDDKEKRKQYGLIYEDTINILPEITTQDDNNKAINYTELVPIMLKEMQELRKRVAMLENRVAELERRDNK